MAPHRRAARVRPVWWIAEAPPGTRRLQEHLLTRRRSHGTSELTNGLQRHDSGLDEVRRKAPRLPRARTGDSAGRAEPSASVRIADQSPASAAGTAPRTACPPPGSLARGSVGGRVTLSGMPRFLVRTRPLERFSRGFVAGEYQDSGLPDRAHDRSRIPCNRCLRLAVQFENATRAGLVFRRLAHVAHRAAWRVCQPVELLGALLNFTATPQRGARSSAGFSRPGKLP